MLQQYTTALETDTLPPTQRDTARHLATYVLTYTDQ
jgi:hypothetical protein